VLTDNIPIVSYRTPLSIVGVIVQYLTLRTRRGATANIAWGILSTFPEIEGTRAKLGLLFRRSSRAPKPKQWTPTAGTLAA
jgi:hypothetical protein